MDHLITRPLLSQKYPEKSIKKILSSRNSIYYQIADKRILTDHKTPQQIAEIIKKIYHEQKKNE